LSPAISTSAPLTYTTAWIGIAHLLDEQ